MRLGVALGAGGARALGNIGVLQVLAENGIKPAVLAGSSMGAIIGAYYAVHGEVDSLAKWFVNTPNKDFLKFAGTPSKYGLVGIKKVRELLAKWYGEVTFADLKIPLRITATSLSKHEPVVIEEGLLVNAVLASMAVPGICPAIKHGDDYFVDGGMTNPTPIDIIDTSKCDQVLGVDFKVRDQPLKEQPTMVETLVRTYEAARSLVVRQRCPKDCTMLQPTAAHGIHLLRFDQSAQHIELGRKSCEKLIEKWEKSGLLKKNR